MFVCIWVWLCEFVCFCVCLYVWNFVSVCVYVYMIVCAHIMFVCLNACTSVCTYCVCVCVQVCDCVHILCLCVWVCVRLCDCVYILCLCIIVCTYCVCVFDCVLLQVACAKSFYFASEAKHFDNRLKFNLVPTFLFTFACTLLMVKEKIVSFIYILFLPSVSSMFFNFLM